MNSTGFIGAGNMGGAILSGMIAAKKSDACNIYVCDKVIKDEIKALGVNIAGLEETVNASDCIILAVKPNVMFDVIEEIKNKCDTKGKLFVSIAAGIKLCDLCAALGTGKVVRVMPNLCLQALEGMSVLCKGDDVTEEEFEFANGIFAASGKTALVKEELIDSCTAINGSGPAYVFMFMEALADAGVKHGIDRKTAYELSAQTVLGSAAMMLKTGLAPAVLKDMVCSPGGTTIEAVQALEDCGMRSAIMAAVDACAQKAAKMGNK